MGGLAERGEGWEQFQTGESEPRRGPSGGGGVQSETRGCRDGPLGEEARTESGSGGGRLENHLVRSGARQVLAREAVFEMIEEEAQEGGREAGDDNGLLGSAGRWMGAGDDEGEDDWRWCC